MEHDGKPIDWDQGEAEPGRGGRGQGPEQNCSKGTDYEKKSEEFVSFVNMTEPRNHTQEDGNEIAGVRSVLLQAPLH